MSNNDVTHEISSFLRELKPNLNLSSVDCILLAELIHQSYAKRKGGCLDVENARFKRTLPADALFAKKWMLQSEAHPLPSGRVSYTCVVGETTNGHRAILDIVQFDCPLIN
ncbi:MAG: hypothetical protein ABJL67_21550 [Sulfitobacter sp.]